MSKTPIVRPVSWLNAGITLGILAIFVFAGYALNRTNGVFFGAVIYLALSQLLRRVIPRNHRKAIRHCKRQEFEQAISEFHKSVAFFRDYEWIDRYRAVTMLSAAGMWYREMAMVSLGFCYAQIGDGPNARQHYEQCLQDFPDNEMVKSALQLMDAGADRGSMG
jgi:tetratricopeptide (TPR) repeat protein